MAGARSVMPVLLLAAAAAALAGCARSTQREELAVQRLYGGGGAVRFLVGLSHERMSAAELLRLRLEARADPGWGIVFPEIPDSLGGFQVTERGKEERRLQADGSVVAVRTYVLEPFLPGDYAIPSLQLSFGETGGGTYPFTLVSEPLPVEVLSSLPPQLGEQDIEEVTGPETLPSRRILWYALGGLAAAGAAALALVLLLRRRRRLPAAARPPWELAGEELERLLARGLLASGRYQEFYTGISDLVRRYVERRFAVRAPEQTTEEFLQHVQGSAALAPHRQLLQEFLACCDLVKFARHRPDSREVERTVDACRSFLAATVHGEAEG